MEKYIFTVETSMSGSRVVDEFEVDPAALAGKSEDERDKYIGEIAADHAMNYVEINYYKKGEGPEY